MSEKDNGGPAFPYEGGQNNNLMPYYGMTLRDYFAAKAMQSISSRSLSEYSHLHNVALIATKAYEMADAMLAERAK